MDDCVFCGIVEGRIPSTKLYEDDRALAFLDISPQAPAHIIVIPKKHTRSFLTCAQTEGALMGHLMNVVAELAQREGLSQDGFRVVTNCGENARQSVDHFHIHILGGGQLSGQMG